MDDIKKYINSLSFKSEAEYLQWCNVNNFSTNFQKTQHQINKEIKTRNLEIFNESMKRHRKIKTFCALIDFIRKNKNIKTNTIESSLRPDIHKNFIGIYESSKHWGVEDLYLDTLEHLDKVSKLTQNNYFSKILSVVLYHEYWIRDLLDWKPNSHNTDKQFSNLIRYLLTKYDIPLFMDSAWNDVQLESDRYRDWFIFIGNGGNIRKANHLIMPLTKKQANYFLQTPENYSIPHAFKFAQIMSEGGSLRLANTLRPTQVMNIDSNKDLFCLSVIKFFIDNPMLDMAHIGPIVDYIWHVKYSNVDPQLNFSMNGRTPESLLNAVERWHRQLGKEKKGGDLNWERCSIKEFEITYGKKEKDNLRTWKIIELTSSKELAKESRAQKNCVSSYANSCYNKQCSIFSLRLFSGQDESFEVKTTIEVRKKEICQMRNIYNKLPSQQDLNIINLWASKENLKRMAV